MKIPTADVLGGLSKAPIESITLLTASKLPSDLVRENRKAMLTEINAKRPLIIYCQPLASPDLRIAVAIINAKLSERET